jgi:amidase
MNVEFWKLTARQAVTLLKRRETAPAELIDAALARISAVEKRVNALPILCAERARAAADRLRPGTLLAGLPVAIKDLIEVEGVRTTWGSPLFANHISPHSDIAVERLEANGALVIAKSNTPEFGAGGNTFNEVFGPTLNPWNTALTCGGSSGGAAVALATGEVWLAQGSDLGGSLRSPASFCSVVGLRPSPGRVAAGPKTDPFDTLSVNGPMARNVGDLALLLDAMVGVDPRDPLSLAIPERPFVDHVDAPRPPRRVAFSGDLGVWPVAAEVRELCVAAARRFEAMGAAVEEACPDFADAREIFQVLRGLKFVAGHAEKLRQSRDRLKAEVIWNIETGLGRTVEEIAWATRARGALAYRTADFFRDYDLLLCPAAAVPPFPVEQRYVAEIDGYKFDNYIDWVGITYTITLTGCPALSLPCGFTADGRPVGLQMVGRPRGEGALLEAAALLERELGLAGLLPIDPRPVLR